MEKENDLKKRNGWIDLLRIISCLFIIGLHVSGHISLESDLWKIIQCFVRPALWTFLALTGYFALKKPIENIFEFWYKHILGLIIPLIIYLAIYYLVANHTLAGFDIFGFIHGDSIGHLWYVYTLITLYIVLPFIQKMLFSMNKKYIQILLISMLIIGRGIEILNNNNFAIGIPTDIIGNTCLFFLILGYYLRLYPIKINYKTIIIFIINLGCTYYALSNPKLVNGACTLSLVMTVSVSFYISLFQSLNKFKMSKLVSKVISFVGKRTYGIYLIHMLIFQYMTQKEFLILPRGNIVETIVYFALKCGLIFVIGLVIAIILDLTIVFILKKIFFKSYDKCSTFFAKHRKTKMVN